MSDTEGTPDVTRGVTQPDLLDRLIRGAIAERVRTMLPASVQKFDASTQKANVQILIQDFARDEEGNITPESVPVVNSVPVMFLTAGGFTFTVPIVEGTTGALVFADRSLDAWLSSQGQEVDPGIYHRLSITDAVFIPGLLTFDNAMSVAPPTDHATAGSIAGARIHFRDGTICVGDESGSDFLALAQKVLSELQKIQTAHNTHVHVLTISGGATGTAAPPVVVYTPASVAAIQAKGH